MSAEVENNKEEDTKEQQKKQLKQRLRENWPIGFKLVELLLCATCLGFAYEPVKDIRLDTENLHHIGIMYTAYTGFMLINSLLLISRAIGDRTHYRTSVLFSANGAVLFLVTGILLIVDRQRLFQRSFHPNMYKLSMILTSIICSFVNVLVFAADAAATLYTRKDF